MNYWSVKAAFVAAVASPCDLRSMAIVDFLTDPLAGLRHSPILDQYDRDLAAQRRKRRDAELYCANAGVLGSVLGVTRQRIPREYTTLKDQITRAIGSAGIEATGTVQRRWQYDAMFSPGLVRIEPRPLPSPPRPWARSSRPGPRWLVELLLGLFVGEEFRHFVGGLDPALARHLPGQGASDVDLANKTASLLVRQAELYDALVAVRPRREDDIRRAWLRRR